jgi:hypothetical protein
MRFCICFLLFALASTTSIAQNNVGIGTNSPHASSILELNSNNRGLLIPRMSSAQRNVIASPAEGLLVYDTDSSAIMIRSSGSWKKITTSSQGDLWLRNGNNMYSGNSGFVGLGVADPLFKLDMKGRMLIRGDSNANNSPGVVFTNINGTEYRGMSGMRNDSVFGFLGVGPNLSNNGWLFSINSLNGRIGINTSLPRASLHVDSGDVLLRGYQLTYPQTPASPPVSGGGGRMMWYAEKAAFRVGHTGPGNFFWPEAGTYIGTEGDPAVWDRDSVGQYSFAAGASNLAKEEASTSFGYTNKSLGFASTSMGYSTTARGRASTSMGDGTVATANSSLAIGTLNDISDTAIFNFPRENDRVFQIGNGFSTFGGPVRITSFSILRNGFTGIGVPDPQVPLHFATVLGKKISLYRGGSGDAGFGVFGNELRIHSDYNGAAITFGFDDLTNGFTEYARINPGARMGLGTNNPLARLHISEGDALFSRTAGSIPLFTVEPPPLEGRGSRMMWYSSLAAFRAGYVDGTNWNKDSIGSMSFAAGYNTKARGVSSLAIGHNATALGSRAIALGDGVRALFDFSVAIGSGSIAQEYAAIAFGLETVASGIQSLATGARTNASGNNSTTMGLETLASGPTSIAMGYRSQASSNDALAANYVTQARGGASATFGALTIAKAYGSLVLGMYNDSSDSPIPLSPASTDRLFQIGNGNASTRSNALTLLRNGNMGLGTTGPIAPLSFPNTLGQKITLWGNNTAANYGFGIQGGLLQIHTGSNADNISLGYGSSTNFTANFTVFGNGNALLVGSLTQFSDARFKKNITPIENALEAIQQLNGYRYQWSDDKLDKAVQIGMLAQELQKIYPELVKEGEDGKLTVNYVGMIPVLLEAIKDLKKELDDVKTSLKENKK